MAKKRQKKAVKNKPVGNTATVASAKDETGEQPKPLGRSDDLVPIAAIGASAGGLEPIETFFDAMPVDSGCAFVIIQHLSPDFRSLMDELLARHSSMNIFRVTDGMEIEPNSIYLNPPRSVMTIKGNRLRIEKIDVQDTVYLPIDLFFQSLAESRTNNAIALVLSGTGSDGTRGAQAVRGSGGKVLVQDPETTRFDGMPKSVIAEDNYNLIATPSDLAKSVARLLKNESLEGLSANVREPLEEPLQDLLSMLKHRYGTEFEQYKDATVKRRIERRAHMRRITDINDYRDLLHTDELELQELYADLLIEVTEFFRDPAAFDILRQEVVPKIMKDLKDGDSMRVWVPGCASGEEAYSIAILLQEQARSLGIYPHLKILATDIHIRSMNKASSGIYTEDALKGIPADLVERYFDSADGQVQIKPSVRNMVFFSTHDVMRDPPFTRIDLISCRNLLIYLKEDAQEKVMNLLHFSLKKDGFLFLGPSEHIGAIAHEFETINEKWRMYKKRRDVKLLPAESIFQRADIAKGVTAPQDRSRIQVKPRGASANTDQSIPFKRAQRAALESIVSQYAPPGFLLTEDGSIVHIFGSAGELLPMQSGSFSKLIVDLIKPELKVIVTAALDHARSKEFKGFRRAAYIKDENEIATNYEVSLSNLELPGEPMRFLLLSIEEQNAIQKNSVLEQTRARDFAPEDSSEALQQRILVLEHSLQSSEESLQSTIEELETSNEELQSTNEELMSTNEELQSTNEELHSVNEELYTVSAEHQRKNEELTERDIDLDTLLQLSKIGTVHLDETLTLLRYTNKARSLFNIMPQDVGRPFHHISVRAVEHDVFSMVKEVNRTQEIVEVQVDIGSEVLLLRIMPHLKDDGMPQGVLITVIDISDLQSVRTELENLNVHYKDIVDSTESYFVRWDAVTNNITFCNEQYASVWGLTAEEAIGRNIVELRPMEDRQKFLEAIASVKINESISWLYSGRDSNNNRIFERITTRGISFSGDKIDEYQSLGIDCTEEQQYQNAIDQLFSVFSDSDLEPTKKLDSILAIGLDYYELDTALISSIAGDRYTVTSIVSGDGVPYETGDVLKISDTMCSQFVDKKSSLTINDVSNSSYNELPCHQKTGIECFVGASIQTANGPYGSVSFSSTNARTREFTSGDESFSLLIAGWIGYLLGNIEQLEIMSSQNEHYQTLFESVPAMMFLCDVDGLVLSASNLFSEEIGSPSESVPGRVCLNYFHSDDQGRVSDALKEGHGYHIPARLVRDQKEDLEVELNMSIKPIGTMKGIRMVIASDVSVRNQASREAQEHNRQLEVANESLNQFAFIASHDLQEPLRKIQQFSSFIEKDLDGTLDDDSRYHLSVIVDASQRMSTLIHDLLSFSGTKKVAAEMKKVDLNALIKDVVVELELPIQESAAKIEIKALPTVMGNIPLLRQLFTNLVSNSVKYRDKNRHPIIKIHTTNQDGKEQIVVADNGIGFEAQFSKKIFEPFNRLHNAKDYKGNGIGLAICHTVCEKHGWIIEGKGQPGKGSKFTITLSDD